MEELIVWSDKYSVKSDEMDSQHKELFNILNIVKVSINKGLDQKAMGLVTQKLLEYTIFHFDAEIEMLEKSNYKKIEEQKDEHDFFIREVSKFRKEYDENDPHLSHEVLGFLKRWLSHHILEEDKKYAALIEEEAKS